MPLQGRGQQAASLQEQNQQSDEGRTGISILFILHGPPALLTPLISWPVSGSDTPLVLFSNTALLRSPLGQNSIGASPRLPAASDLFLLPELRRMCIGC